VEQKGLAAVRRLMDGGFNYDNLQAMAGLCRDERAPAHLLTAFLLHHTFLDIAEQLGDGPVLVSDLRKLEAKYRTIINLALEEALAGEGPEKEVYRLSNLIRLHWGGESH
jgi:hypothetical protein